MHCTCQRLAMAVMSTLRSVGGLGWLIVALEDRSSTTAAAVAGHSNLFARRDEALTVVEGSSNGSSNATVNSPQSASSLRMHQLRR